MRLILFFWLSPLCFAFHSFVFATTHVAYWFGCACTVLDLCIYLPWFFSTFSFIRINRRSVILILSPTDFQLSNRYQRRIGKFIWISVIFEFLSSVGTSILLDCLFRFFFVLVHFMSNWAPWNGLICFCCCRNSINRS